MRNAVTESPAEMPGFLFSAEG
ncbi:protein of unknown function [Cupriavidus neocaledonicus]|uniref:Uncharacterized protein n=1 Tax=Cupriavidus neocaledonicus TaxID=1040979 RepID=A0A375H9G2_9BURK|nr:hypothetical protein CBM2605_A10015 [Cupriavidus neocaledonicus]SPD48651.1 protein of unknown function [Cupriavidus neocaledonicus]